MHLYHSVLTCSLLFPAARETGKGALGEGKGDYHDSLGQSQFIHQGCHFAAEKRKQAVLCDIGRRATAAVAAVHAALGCSLPDFLLFSPVPREIPEGKTWSWEHSDPLSQMSSTWIVRNN